MSDSKNHPASVLVTGATGFVGSSLAARLLKEGKRVIALSRKDPDGIKTRAAVERGARTLGIALPPLNERLVVLSAPLADAPLALTEAVLKDVESVWHSAALLTYDAAKLHDCLQTNVEASANLYRIAATRAPRCRRFYHVSTAYSIGLPADEQPIAEELHASARQPNVYQLSKWAAEMSLRALATEHRLPLTVVRPSVVVGHSRTGQYHGDPFGIYMFFLAGHRLRRAGVSELHLSPETRGLVNLIPIDVLVENMFGLCRRESPTRPAFEVIHATGNEVSSEEVAAAAAVVMGLTVDFAGARSEVDREFARAVEDNRVFVGHSFRFQQGRLGLILGPTLAKTIVDGKMLTTLMSAYQKRLDRELGVPTPPTHKGAVSAGAPLGAVSAGAP